MILSLRRLTLEESIEKYKEGVEVLKKMSKKRWMKPSKIIKEVYLDDEK